MKEFLDIFSQEGECIGQVEKKASHERMRKEYFETGEVTERHKHVRLLLLTSKGGIILQRRSKWKGDNAGLWDKTIGGHVTSGDGFDLTMLKECAEELGIPSTIVKEEEFDNCIQVTDLHILGILRKLVFLDNQQSPRKSKNKTWVEPSMTQFYIGYYDGPIQFIDNESCGIQVYTKEELEQDIAELPDLYTEDIKYIFKKFKDQIKPVEIIRDKVNND